MKKVLTVLVVFMLVSSMAVAKGGGKPPKGGSCCPEPEVASECSTYLCEEYQPLNPMGLGIDVTLYEFEGKPADWGLENIELQQKWDLNNDTYSIFGVCQVNLWQAVKKVMNK